MESIGPDHPEKREDNRKTDDLFEGGAVISEEPASIDARDHQEQPRHGGEDIISQADMENGPRLAMTAPLKIRMGFHFLYHSFSITRGDINLLE